MTTIATRKQKLQEILRAGVISESNKTLVIEYFNKYYQVDDDEEKIKHVSDCDIRRCESYGTYCFYIHDGNTWVTVSLSRLAGQKPSKAQLMIKALRKAIEYQITGFRNNNKKPSTCPVLGCDMHEAEVDHLVKFSDIVKQWGKNPTVKYNKENLQYEFEDNILLSEWQTFHKTHAVLRWISKKANRQLG